MRIRVPSRKTCERFYVIYELRGVQAGVDFLARHYRIRRMKVTLDGRRVGEGYTAFYFENGKAYFSKQGLNKRTALHEFYHHLVCVKGMDIPVAIEERNANYYARKVLRSRYRC